MSKVIFACRRVSDFSDSTLDRLSEICKLLTPDNLTSVPEPRICVFGKTAYAVTLPNSALHETGSSLLLGWLYEKPGTEWSTPEQTSPDGNYALFRDGGDKLEVVSDAAGSRTLWYYYDANLFVSSTSQRAIILFLGKFEFDERVIPWMLSTGSQGPEFSWDKNLKRLQADSSVILDKKTWTISNTRRQVIFSSATRTREQHQNILAEAVRQTIRGLSGLDFSRWALPLSGGVDSRAILCYIKEQLGIPKGLKAVTWGLELSMDEEDNDAVVARDLAGVLGVPHEWYTTDLSSESVDTVLNRFVLCSEGRIDQISGYMDGMEIWRRLHDEGIEGVIRGDEGFGWVPVSSELKVRLSVGCALCTDFENLENLSQEFSLHRQELPSVLLQAAGESLEQWRDRLYQSYRIPSVLAALSDIKFSYIEQITPLLSRSILTAARTIPDDLRTNKLLFREIVDAIGPDVPFARMEATAERKDILRNRAVVSLLKSEIGGSDAVQLLGSRFIRTILDGIMEDPSGSKPLRVKVSVRSLVPRFVRNWLRLRLLRPRVDGNVLAFRVFLIIKMQKVLKAHAARFSS